MPQFCAVSWLMTAGRMRSFEPGVTNFLRKFGTREFSQKTRDTDWL